MASRGLGQLTLDLIAKIGGFVGPLGQAERELDKRSRAMEARAHALGSAIGASVRNVAGQVAGFATAFVSIGAVIDGFRIAIDAADKLDEFSEKLGISAEKLSTLGYAAQQSDTSLDDLLAALPKLSKFIIEAGDASSTAGKLFKELDIDPQGGLAKASDILPQLADRFKALDNETVETGLAMAAFGKSGAGLLNFLNRGSEGIGELEQRARELGIELNGDTAGGAAEFKDRLADLKATTQALFTQLAAELLPQLTKLVEWAVQFTRDGGNATKVAEAIGRTFDVVGPIVGIAAEKLDAFGKMIEGLTGIAIALGTALKGAFSFNVKEAAQAAAAATVLLQSSLARMGEGALGLTAIDPRRPGTASPPSDSEAGGIDFSRGAPVTPKEAAEMEARLSGILGGGDGGKPKPPKKSGPSDAEKEADRLKKAYESMNESLTRQIGLVGAKTEADRVSYEITSGSLSKISQAQKDALLAQARELDQKEARNKLEEEGRRLTESLLEPAERINAERAEAANLLAAGVISQEAYNKAIAAHQTPAEQMLADMQFEIQLLGQSADAIELETARRWLGIEALTADGVAALAALQNRQKLTEEMRVQVELMDEFRSGFGDAITDFVTGAKSMKDAFTDFANDFARRVTQMIAERWMEKLFGEQGSSGAGTSGGDWIGSILGALFKRAEGGPVTGGSMYRVNERGPELLTVSGRDYLMMGKSSGTVTPNHKLGGGGMSLSQTFVVQGTPDRRTREQMARDSGRQAQRGMARTGR